MVSTSETGHAKNVANFATLISFCTAYGANYNPSNPALSITELNNLHTSAQTSLSTLNDVFAA